MSDRVLSVRQIAGYQFVQTASDGDSILMQRGGLGGPYVWTNPSGFLPLAVSALQSPSGSAALLALLGSPVGVSAMADALALRGNRTFAQIMNGQAGFNFYRDGGVLRYLQDGVAGQWLFAGGVLTFTISAAGKADQPVTLWKPLFTLEPDGMMLAQQLRLARDPVRSDEAVTLDLLRRDLGRIRETSVHSFNGRVGDVCLGEGDIAPIFSALIRPLIRTSPDPGASEERIATTEWAQNAISFRLTDLLSGHPFVFSFNGRTGDIVLRPQDIDRVLHTRGYRPTVPTPPFGDSSKRIANTRWVQDELDAIALKPGPVGPQGPQGPQGTGFNIRGAVPTENDLPATGNESGDLFITQDTNTGFLWDGTAWKQIGLITPSSRVIVSDTAPITAQNGDLWWNSLLGDLMVYFEFPPGQFQWVVANANFAGGAGGGGGGGPSTITTDGVTLSGDGSVLLPLSVVRLPTARNFTITSAAPVAGAPYTSISVTAASFNGSANATMTNFSVDVLDDGVY